MCVCVYTRNFSSQTLRIAQATQAWCWRGRAILKMTCSPPPKKIRRETKYGKSGTTARGQLGEEARLVRNSEGLNLVAERESQVWFSK